MAEELPSNAAEAEALVHETYDKVLDIQNQLGNRNQCHPGGERMSDHEYHAWRHSAKTALKHKIRDHREAKANLKAVNVRDAMKPNISFDGHLRTIVGIARRDLTSLPLELRAAIVNAHGLIMQNDRQT